MRVFLTIRMGMGGGIRSSGIGYLELLLHGLGGIMIIMGTAIIMGMLRFFRFRTIVTGHRGCAYSNAC
jgi:hypothetical protein